MEKSVLITGASQGLGLALSEYFSKHGYFVFACGFSKDAPLFGAGRALRCDISDEFAVSAMFAETGTPDVLINNARFCPSPRDPSLSDGEWWDRNLAISLKGTYLCCRAAMRGMKERKSGAIVNVSSIRAKIANDPDRIPYGAAKAGQLNLTTSFAAEGAPYNIRVNALLPGAIETENLRKRITPERYAEVAKEIPLGRMGRMEEICHAALFLAENSYTTGIFLNCSGGLLMQE